MTRCGECRMDVDETVECGSGSHTVWNEAKRVRPIDGSDLFRLNAEQLRALKRQINSELAFRASMLKNQMEEEQ